MRRFRESASRWPISAACIAAFVWPILAGVVAPSPAAAQIGTIEVCVVDFVNQSKVPNVMFATMATDAVVVELLRSGRFSVTGADQMQAAMEDLGYKAKGDRTPKFRLTESMMVRLGQQVGASSVVTGEIASIQVDSEKKRATVRIVLKMLDVASGEYINGGIATGESHARIGYTPDRDTDWIIEAINNASRKAVETMVEYIIPEGTVLATLGTNEVLLNKGSQDGIWPGMEMIALRRGETGVDDVVGRVRVTTVNDSNSNAVIVRSTRGVRPEDRVRAVYELPKDVDQDAAAPRADSKKAVRQGTKWLWTLLAAVGLYALVKPDNSKESVPGAIAVAYADPVEFGSFMSEIAILVAWNDLKDVRYQDILEYHVWRDNHAGYGGGGENVLIGPCLVPSQTSAIPLNSALGRFDHHAVDDIPSRSLEFSFPGTDHTELDSGSTEMIGITPGKSHNYWVSAVYRRMPSKSEDEGGAVTYWETTPVYAGRATAFQQRPRTLSPGDVTGMQYIGLDDITFEWEGCRGADRYVIEVSTTPTFVREQTWVSVITRPTSQDGTYMTETYRDVLSVSPELRNIATEQRLYWRVGARNSLDNPGPYPAGPTPTASGSKNTRYIYSDPNELLSFQTLGGVPPPPEY